MRGIAAFVTFVDTLPPGLLWDKDDAELAASGHSTVRVTALSFNALVSALKALGYNPFSCRTAAELDTWLSALTAAQVDALTVSDHAESRELGDVLNTLLDRTPH